MSRPDDDVTRTSGDTDETRLSPPGTGPSISHSGWLTSSSGVDYGRFSPGSLLDNRYRVLGLLGRGGMGEVYRAEDLRLGQQVALKFLPEALAVDARRLAQFHNEVRTARQVSHPHVCRVYDIGEVDGQLYLSMEYVDGEDLSVLLRRIGRLPEERAVEIARQICSGLAAAHERGILHRDLKPANIMLDGAGKVRIMDFSLAAVGQVDDVRAGTPAYMAPEQLAGKEVTVRSDIYALGLVLYEVFTGKRAFEAKTIADLVAQHQSGQITAPASLVSSLDEAVDRAIMRCLDPEPLRRPTSALAVAAALPGGDPLAAALAAGETPSPEMVAAAGAQTATLTPTMGALWLAIFAVAVFFCLRVSDRASLFARVPLAKSGDVLADRADQIRQSIGYVDAPSDTHHGFTANQEYLSWATKSISAEDRSRYLVSGRPAALQFWYRTSPAVLVPRSPLASVNSTDPQLAINGMTLVVTDTMGRLTQFAAVPPQQEPAPATPPAVADWDKLFAAAAVDRTAFTEVAPSRTPPVFADERHAWQGTYTGTSIPVRIEAAAYRGRPVLFEIVGPWTTAPRDSTKPATVGTSNPYIIAFLLIGALLAARANLRSGRADRRGAFRLAAFMFAVIMTTWLLDWHVRDAPSEMQRFFASTGIALFLGAVMYLIYLGLEPWVRRTSPMVLVGWSRVVSGRIRDPLVGRDVLIGVACGAVAAFLNVLPYIASRWAGVTELEPFSSNGGALEGVRPFLRDVAQGFNGGLQSALIMVFEWVSLRMGFDWLWNHGARRLLPKLPAASERALLVLVAIFLIIIPGLSGANTKEVLLNLLYQALSVSLILGVIVRVGLFGSAVGFLVGNYLSNMPMTLDSSKLYASESFALVAGIAALAFVGLSFARGGDAPRGRFDRMR